MHRPTLVSKAANLWKAKELVWQRLPVSIRHNRAFAPVDSFLCSGLSVRPGLPLSALIPSGERGCFREGWPVPADFFGFRVYVHLSWAGFITRFGVAPADVHELKLSTISP